MIDDDGAMVPFAGEGDRLIRRQWSMTSRWPVRTLPPRHSKAGLVDECHLFLTPIMVGGGKSALPPNVRLKLELLDEHRFGNGVMHLHYRTMTF
jgi:hypothetical protein